MTNALIIFTRNPELGKCKTRLAKAIGDEEALKIYKHLLQHTANVAKKVDAALANDIRVIFCFGEELTDRKAGKENEVVASQIKNALFHLPESSWGQIVLAYEPVWAIGTGETATPEQAQEMHAFIRSIIEEKYNKEVSENVSILYGGSVKPANAKEIFSKPDVDGGLIGGAALKAEDFYAIVNAF